MTDKLLGLAFEEIAVLFDGEAADVKVDLDSKDRGSVDEREDVMHHSKI